MAIRRLPLGLINRIAAGEVVERPASAMKELVENSLDAGAHKIEVRVRHGGQSFLSVTDDGKGIPQDELAMALERHATSKLPHDDLLAIHSFGFRGEALAALGAVSRLTLHSRTAGQDQGWSVAVEGGSQTALRPRAMDVGTRVEVADLFFATPARLKFLKSERAEVLAIRQIFSQIALAHPTVGFELWTDDRLALAYPPPETSALDDPDVAPEAALFHRVAGVMGREFAHDGLTLRERRDGYGLGGFLSVPTFNKPHGQDQFFFVNGRPIRDKLLASLVKVAYHDVLPHGRFPAVVMFLDVPVDQVDVNVHPAKIEVRFSNTSFLREFVLQTLKSTLAQVHVPTSIRLATQTHARFVSATPMSTTPISSPSMSSILMAPLSSLSRSAVDPKASPTCAKFPSSQPVSFQPSFPEAAISQVPSPQMSSAQVSTLQTGTGGAHSPHPSLFQDVDRPPLGYAIGQLHGRYIVTQTQHGCLIVDQHAAHERLVYESLKKQLTAGSVESEALLIPLLLPLTAQEKEGFERVQNALGAGGLVCEILPPLTLMVRAIPALLKDEDWPQILKDILQTLDESLEQEEMTLDPLTCALNLVLSHQACQRRSIKSGKKLSLEEMNALLRAMEQTPHAAHCNHGRPTYVSLERRHLDSIFERTG